MAQQYRALMTRETILRVAAAEFDRLGYDAVPLSAILRRSGLTKGAFYFHFESKEALALAIVRQQEEEWPRLLAAWRARGLDPLRTLVGLVDEVVSRLSVDVRLRAGVRLAADRGLEFLGLANVHLRWERAMSEILSLARDEGQLRPGADPDAAARVLCASLFGARLISTSASGCADFSQRVREVWSCLLLGVAAPEWGPQLITDLEP
ncbi:ScbR family autoregulator-binding transcription factor [Umezawaea beigongshangensis]|uniref:ScbR family autoregulator-binding transcription factor n=1 Tax=Umezawaea beigongshangensis TaxID=2780383 RepID=UPI0018F1B4B7|nr:ScbR family autoregulator-binding transcription factor [Umezawaea beigongshangensis]